jgi:H+/gluconate symporter-like permease
MLTRERRFEAVLSFVVIFMMFIGGLAFTINTVHPVQFIELMEFHSFETKLYGGVIGILMIIAGIITASKIVKRKSDEQTRANSGGD